jgi:hypothetical protein
MQIEMKDFLRIFILICMLVLSPSSSLGDTGAFWPDFPAPNGANVGWVARDIIYNGVPMQIRHMSSELKPEEIIGFYRKEWQKTEKDKLLLEKKPPWYLIHRITDSVFYTVEVRPVGSGSEAILTLSRLPEIQNRFLKDSASVRKLINSQGDRFPRLTGSSMQMDMTSFDDGVQARTIMYRNKYDVEANVLYISEELIASGWSKSGDYRTQKGDMGRQLVFKRTAEQIVMTVRQEAGTTEVVANHTKQL